MKTFIRTFLLFAAPIVVFTVVPAAVEWHVFRAAVRKPKAHIGIIGDSHADCGIDPKYFPGLANFAQRASQPMVWRAKLGVILDENPQIDTFLIDLWTGVLTRDAEKSSKERAHFARNHIPANVLLDVFRTKEMGGLPDDNLGRNFIKGVVCPFLARCFTGSRKSALQDDYYPLDRNLVDSSWYRAGAKVDDPNSWNHAPVHSATPVRAEIEDILSELKRRNVRPVLVTLPFLSLMREQLFTKEDELWFEREVHDLCQKYGCSWINLVDEVSDISFWADSGHLNVQGAERATRCLRKAINKMLGKNDDGI